MSIFHNEGCRLSDYGLETAYAEQYGADEIAKIFEKIRTNKPLEAGESLKFKSAMMFELASMDAEAGWVMQLHIGALRNTNSRMLGTLGPDTGYDSIGDFEIARPLAMFLDRLNAACKLPKTILYNLNPADNAVMATMAGNFQDGILPGQNTIRLGVVVPRPEDRNGRANRDAFEYGAFEPVYRNDNRLAEFSVFSAPRVFPQDTLQHHRRRRGAGIIA